MEKLERYNRQMILPGFGTAAQEKLQAASVLVVGAGGLGCPVLQYLSAAGVGTIGIVDGDSVSLSNLHRQVLYRESDIGLNKAKSAAEHLQQLNSETEYKIYPYALMHANALDIIAAFDMVVDATDNFAARYTINDACVLLNKPFVYGAVSGYEGQLSFFNLPAAGENTITYRDLFPVPPAAHEIPNCAEAGVLGTLPGLIGTLQANEAIKYLTGIGELLHGRLLTIDLLTGKQFEMKLTASANKGPVTKEQFIETGDEIFCDTGEDIEEISIAEFLQMKEKENVFVLDVREKKEYPPIDFSDAQIPMSELKEQIYSLPEKEICIICHQGIRSIYAAQLIRNLRGLPVYSVRGGLTAYFNQQP